jgi:peptide/nickel transport system substrate-binding protein
MGRELRRRKKMIKKIRYLFLGALMMLAAMNLAPSSGTAQPVRGGTLTIGMIAEPAVLDSCSGAWNIAPFAGNMLSSILETDENMKIGPGIAESWSLDARDKTYTFNIRKGAKWHDGKPFTVQDVKFTFETFLPKFDDRGEYLKDSKVDIVSDTKVVLKPGRWVPAIQTGRMACVDWVIYPKHLLEGVDFMKSDFRKAPIGTGPFKFKEWVRGSHITLERNNDYWKPNKPYLDRIIFKFIRDPSIMLASLTTGEVDFAYRGLPYEAYETMKKSPNLNVILDYKPNYKVLLVNNTRHPILSNLLVRQAFAHAIDKKDIASKSTSNVCRPSDLFFAPELLPPNPNIKVYDYNSKKAEELLDQAGYPRKSGGIRFSIQLLERVGEADEEKAGDLFKDYLKAVGVDVTIKKVDFNTALQMSGNYQFDIMMFKRLLGPYFTYSQHHSSFIKPGVPLTNISQYKNPKVDQWYDHWAQSATEEEQKKGLLNAETIMTEDLPELPLFDVSWMYVWNKRVQNPFVPVRNWLQSEPLDNIYIK